MAESASGERVSITRQAASGPEWKRLVFHARVRALESSRPQQFRDDAQMSDILFEEGINRSAW